jgi:hypothetical protein
MADPYELIKKPMGGPPEQPSGGAPGSMDSLGLPGYLSFDQWSKPSQAKWFKKSKGPNQTAESVYQQWLQMLQQRAAAPAPAAAPPPGGGRGRRGGPPGGASAPPPGGKPQGGRGGNQASLGGGQPPPGWGPKGGRPYAGGPTIASQNRAGSLGHQGFWGENASPPPNNKPRPGGGMTPITGGGLQAGSPTAPPPGIFQPDWGKGGNSFGDSAGRNLPPPPPGSRYGGGQQFGDFAGRNLPPPGSGPYPGVEQQANPMDIISRLLRQYQGGQRGQSMMGGKG